MKLLILGGGSCQVNAIRQAKKKGHTVIVADYYADAPGKEYCDYGEMRSTFDIAGNIKIANKYLIDGIMTSGTDQPVYTAARVASELGLPSLINLSTARAVTNKKEMKKIFSQTGIPTIKYHFIKEKFSSDRISAMKFPVVVKPLDSQGQRGVFKLKNIKEIRESFAAVLSFSREEEILLEEYYPADEITVSGWVVNSQLFLLTITDRISYENGPHIGICTAHAFPSRYLKSHYQEIKEISERIVDSFNIKNGPIYFQMLIGESGVKVNEIACRIGGAYEDIFIPIITGVDIMEMMIDSALGLEIDTKELKKYNLLANPNWLSVQLFFARAGRIESLTAPANLKKLPGVIDMGYNFQTGDQIGEIENATQRAGYLIVKGGNKLQLEANLEQALDTLAIYDDSKRNMVMKSLGR